MNAISNHSTPDERPSRRSACRTLGMLAHNGQMGIAASGPLSELLRTRSLTKNRSLQSTGPAGTGSSARSTGASALMRTIYLKK